MRLNLVPAKTGLNWIRLGALTFKRQPLALAGLFFIFMAWLSLAAMIPFIGLPLAMTLLPAATLGLMVAAREADAGRFPMPRLLISGFLAGTVKAQRLLALGVLYAIGFMAAMGLAYLVDGGSFARMYLGGQAPSAEVINSDAFMSAMSVFVGLHLPLSLVFWHAPALVYWHDLPTLKSMFFSVVACFRNFWAMVLFGLGWVVVMAMGLVALTSMATLMDSPALASLALPVMLVFVAMFFTSLYFSFRDSFDT
jgi:hypothetical protein